MTNLFGGSAKPPAGGNPDSNSLISDTTTVLCLDDYHAHDREGRKKAKVNALAPTAQNFGAPAGQIGRGEL
jgi:phosphoribulokinase